MAGLSSLLFDLIVAHSLKVLCGFLVDASIPSSTSSSKRTRTILNGRRSSATEELDGKIATPVDGPESVGLPGPSLDIANNPFLVVVTPISQPLPNEDIRSTPDLLPKPEDLTSSSSSFSAGPNLHESISSACAAFSKGSTPNKARFLPGALLNLPEDVIFLPRKRCGAFTRGQQRCASCVDLNENQIQDILLIPPKEVTVFCGRHGHHEQRYSVGASPIQAGIPPVDGVVPKYISERTRFEIESKLLEPPSASDGPGVLYIFEIIATQLAEDESQANIVKYKVGRTDNLERRMSEWTKQCGVQMIARFQFPNDGSGGSPMRGMVKKGDTVAWVHKTERLVHLELQDLIRTEIYLDSQWPDATPAQVSKETNRGHPQHPGCAGCGKRHQEVFEFKRLHGTWAKREWEFIIKPIIEKWGRLVNQRATTLEAEAGGHHPNQERSKNDHNKESELMD